MVKLLLFSLKQIKQELLDSQQKVAFLQELSAQLLVAAKPQGQASEQSRTQGSECLEAKEKVHVIMNRLRLLLRQVSGDLEGLEKNLEATDKQQVSKTQVQKEEGSADVSNPVGEPSDLALCLQTS